MKARWFLLIALLAAALGAAAGYLAGTSHGTTAAEGRYAVPATQTPAIVVRTRTVVHTIRVSVVRTVTVPVVQTVVRTITRTRTVTKTRLITKTVTVVATATAGTGTGGIAPATALPQATTNPSSHGSQTLASGDPHICLFSHFDQTNVRCLKDDNSIDLTQQQNAYLVWDWNTDAGTDSNGFANDRDTFNILKQDGTGAWVQVGTATMGNSNPIQNYYDDSTPRKYIKVSDVFLDTGVYTDCNTSFKIQLAAFLGPTYGSVPINLTC